MTRGKEDRILLVTKAIQEHIPHKPDMLLILGSGLGGLVESLREPVSIPYKNLPDFPITTVEGHEGQLVGGYLGNKYVIAMRGRFHYYEGYKMEELVFPIQAIRRLGAETLIVTNAAGIVNRDYKPGELMLIEDHINMTGRNPLRGPNDDEFGPRFPDMTEAYDRELRMLAKKCAVEQGILLHAGIYVGTPGPSYETPAEIRMIRYLGGDAVGMSTVPEVIVANHCGMRVLGISCLTNYGAGMREERLNHEDSMAVSAKSGTNFTRLLLAIVEKSEKQKKEAKAKAKKAFQQQ